jgi:hypothetical protein
MIGKILVPLDGSAFAECALRLALALSEKTGAEVRLAMVNEPLDITPGPWAEAFLSNHVEYMDSITDSMANRGSLWQPAASLATRASSGRTACRPRPRLTGPRIRWQHGDLPGRALRILRRSIHHHRGKRRVLLEVVEDDLVVGVAVGMPRVLPVFVISGLEAEGGHASAYERRVITTGVVLRSWKLERDVIADLGRYPRHPTADALP